MERHERDGFIRAARDAGGDRGSSGKSGKEAGRDGPDGFDRKLYKALSRAILYFIFERHADWTRTLTALVVMLYNAPYASLFSPLAPVLPRRRPVRAGG